MKRTLLTLLLLMPSLLWAQNATLDYYKTNPNYYYGYGRGKTMAEAETAARAELLSSISVNISDDTEMEITLEGAKLKSIMRTYSNMQLNNLRKEVVKEEPNAEVIYYILRSEVASIWEGREMKVRHFCDIAATALQQLNIGDALKHYYWAYALLESIPTSNSIFVDDANGDPHLASVWIRQRINEILASVKVKVERDPTLSGSYYDLYFFVDDKPVGNLDFSYSDGGVSVRHKATDGKEVIQLYPGHIPEWLNVNIEYKYLDDAKSEKEVSSVLGVANPFYSDQCEKRLSMKSFEDAAKEREAIRGLTQQTATNLDQQTTKAAAKGLARELSADQTARFTKVLDTIAYAIQHKKYDLAIPFCTAHGYQIFDTLMRYGKALLLGRAPYTFSESHGRIYARPIPLHFQFSKNRNFSEDVILVLTPEGLVDDIKFGLGKVATNSILTQPSANLPDEVKTVMLDFLENFKTAYCLRRLDYLKKVFSDDAVIIVGNVLERYTGSVETGFESHPAVTTNSMSKQQYMQNLEKVFKRNEFVNVQFAGTTIYKVDKRPGLYAIQMQQDYRSSTYGDTGYLMLMVDLSDPVKPVIYIRVWQDKPDPEFGFINLYTFG